MGRAARDAFVESRNSQRLASPFRLSSAHVVWVVRLRGDMDDVENQAFEALFAPIETPLDQWPQGIIHYTSADSFKNIFLSKSLQFSASSAMNDTREVLGPLAIIPRYWHGARCKAWKDAMSQAWPQFIPAFETYFTNRMPAAAGELYLSCWCKYDINEFPTGKLSMWRAYGDDGRGMAILIDTKPLRDFRISGVDGFPIQFFKTRYENDQQFEDTLHASALACLNHIGVLHAVAAQRGLDDACWWLFQAWIQAAATRKHPGFREEEEWRFIYVRSWDHQNTFSSHVGVATIRGQIRPRMLLPVIDYGHLGLPGTDFNKIVVGTIMGPNLADKSSTHRAALMLMEGAGLANASNRIVICDTPYRSAI